MSHHIGETCSGCGVCRSFCPVEAIAGGKKERHVIDPDRCIECGACGRICPEGAVRDAFGIPVAGIKRPLWPKPKILADRCISCNICVDACPVRCLSLPAGDEKRPHPIPELSEPKRCIGCGFCARECPLGAIFMKAAEP